MKRRLADIATGDQQYKRQRVQEELPNVKSEMIHLGEKLLQLQTILLEEQHIRFCNKTMPIVLLTTCQPTIFEQNTRKTPEILVNRWVKVLQSITQQDKDLLLAQSKIGKQFLGVLWEEFDKHFPKAYDAACHLSKSFNVDFNDVIPRAMTRKGMESLAVPVGLMPLLVHEGNHLRPRDLFPELLPSNNTTVMGWLSITEQLVVCDMLVSKVEYWTAQESTYSKKAKKQYFVTSNNETQISAIKKSLKLRGLDGE